jgi:hypothetical protein
MYSLYSIAANKIRSSVNFIKYSYENHVNTIYNERLEGDIPGKFILHIRMNNL